ncbi:MAG: universal stress protein [Actinobacteria bacterium]|nr:universal stress protein [Actinomycetota bacterium]OJU84416.1 MAG: hypothetical protein BGO11_06620 [Solirubrobacterales bacterium 70-9]
MNERQSVSSISRPILIAYDGSDFAKAAVREAADLFRGIRKAVVVTVFEPFASIPFFGAAGLPVEQKTAEELLHALRAGAERTAAEGCELARDGGLDAEPAVLEGTPVWEGIVNAAEEHDADLLVIGSRGLSGIKHVVLGSVAAAVAQHSRRSVLICHQR